MKYILNFVLCVLVISFGYTQELQTQIPVKKSYLVAFGLTTFNKVDIYPEITGSRGLGCYKWSHFGDISNQISYNASISKTFRIGSYFHFVPSIELIYFTGETELVGSFQCVSGYKSSDTSHVELREIGLRIPLMVQVKLGDKLPYPEFGIYGVLPLKNIHYIGRGIANGNEFLMPLPELRTYEFKGESISKLGLGVSFAIGYDLAIKRQIFQIKGIYHKSINQNYNQSKYYGISFDFLGLQIGKYL